MACKCSGNYDKGKMSDKQRKAIAAGMKGKTKSTAQKKSISEGMKKSCCKKAKTVKYKMV